MSDKIKDPVSNTMLGLALVNKIVGDDGGITEAAKIWPRVLSDELEQLMRLALYMSEFKRVALTVEDLQNEKTSVAYQRLKSWIRDQICTILDQAEAQDQAAKRQQVLTELAKTNQPSEHGTVAEIAQRLGISKSEVRRRKANGTL